MKLPKHPTLLRSMRDARVKQLAPRCPPLAASLGLQPGGGAQVTLKERGKTRTVYVPKDLKEEVETSIQEHRRLKRLLQEITQLQLALIRLHRTQHAPARRQGLSLGATLAKTVAHFFPDWSLWLGQITDTRDQDAITYSRQFLTWMILQVLEAKLVTPDGLAISLGSEFIENADPKASKQDCELKAFQRLAKRLKKDFPQLSLCLLFDALSRPKPGSPELAPCLLPFPNSTGQDQKTSAGSAEPRFYAGSFSSRAFWYMICRAAYNGGISYTLNRCVTGGTRMIIAGIDEAGYGPLLGPLVVSATAFELEGVPLPIDTEDIPCLWRLLRAAVAKKGPAKKGRLLIADSKIVRALADGNKLLERGVLAFLRTYRPRAAAEGGSVSDSDTAAALLETLGCTNHELTSHPWYAPGDLPVPWLVEPGDLAIATNMVTEAMTRARMTTVAMRTAVVGERAFNRLLAGTNNKASALISITLGHLYHLHHTFGHQGLLVGVDKQGGRDFYTALLLQTFPDAQLKVLVESPTSSSYLLTEAPRSDLPGRVQGSGRRTLICFRAKGESAFLPTALASMICKYLRELCMHSFNVWWCRNITGLRPTAGYYQDGERWLVDVAPHLKRLGVAREMLVRAR